MQRDGSVRVLRRRQQGSCRISDFAPHPPRWSNTSTVHIASNTNGSVVTPHALTSVSEAVQQRTRILGLRISSDFKLRLLTLCSHFLD